MMTKSIAGLFTGFCLILSLFCVTAWAENNISPGIPHVPIKNGIPAMLAMEVPTPPIPMRGGGKINLLYEMHISNLGGAPIYLEKIQVTGGGESNRIYATYRGKDFNEMLGKFGAQPAGSDIREILPGMRVVAYIWLSFTDKNAVPDQLHHRLYYKFAKSRGNLRFLSGPTVTVNKRKVPEILSPLIGKRWLATEGPLNNKEYSHHRFDILTFGGKPYIPQRYAIDWVKFGPDGKLFKGDPKKNENWYCYGKEIHSVADGTVIEMKDGIPQNVPFEKKRAVPMTLDTIAGNYLLIKIGSDCYALYAHMIPGSIRVKVGDRVTPGEVLGRLGNSGNSDTPHLHFQLNTKPAGYILASEGLPYTIRSFTCQGRIPVPFPPELLKRIKNIGDVTWTSKVGMAIERHNEMPLGYGIYSFSR